MHARCNDTTWIGRAEHWAVASLWAYAITCVYAHRLVHWPCQNDFVALRRFHFAKVSCCNRATIIVYCQLEARANVLTVSHVNIIRLNGLELAAIHCSVSVINRGLVLLYSTLIGFIPADEKRVLLKEWIILENVATAAIQIDKVHRFVEPSVSLRLGVLSMRTQFRVIAYLDANMV